MTYSEFRSVLKKGAYGSFFFYGPEAYLKRHTLAAIRNKIASGENAFNHFRFNQDSYSAEKAWDAVQCPVFSESGKLVEIEGLSFDAMSDGEIDDLCALMKNAEKYETTLVLYTEPDEFDPGTEKQPTKLFKKFAASAVPVLFARETQAKLIKWIQQHFSAENVFASADSAESLIARCGTDMFALSSEISKLSAYVNSRGPDGDGLRRLTQDDIAVVCAQNDEFDAFAMTDAIISGDSKKAFAVLSDMKSRREKPEIILGGICSTACDMYLIKTLSDLGLSKNEIASKLKIHEYRVGLYLKRVANRTADELRFFALRCHDADFKIKNSFSDSYEIIDKLMAESM